MWFSPESVHRCRGRIRGNQLCEHCMTPIEPGQPYHRQVWRPNKRSRLHALLYHLDARDCPEEEFLALDRDLEAEPVALSLQLVLKQVEVIALDVTGKSFVDTKSILTVEAVTEAEDAYPDYDEDIPF